MKGAILRKYNEIEFEELPIPVPGVEEALIKVEYAGICGTDVHVFLGNHPTSRPPVILGHELVGKLVEINTTKGTSLKIGDTVVSQPFSSCNSCDLCVQGRDNICTDLKIFGIHQDGCFAEYVKVPLKKIYRVPLGIDSRLAALLEPLAVAVHDVKRSDLKVGQTVFIIGGGPIGILIAIVARLNGASKVVISEVNESRIQFAEDLGFTVINPLKEDVNAEVSKITDGKGFDKVFEVSGTSQGAELMTKVVKIGGKIVLVGIPKGKYPVDLASIILEELKIEGVRIHSQINFSTAIDILLSGVLNDQLNKLITNEFPLMEIKEAMKFSIEDQVHFKVLLKI